MKRLWLFGAFIPILFASCDVTYDFENISGTVVLDPYSASPNYVAEVKEGNVTYLYIADTPLSKDYQVIGKSIHFNANRKKSNALPGGNMVAIEKFIIIQ